MAALVSDPAVDELEAALERIVTPPRHRIEDDEPAAFAEHVLCGAAQHAFAVDRLVERGVTAVVNCAPAGAHDCRAMYAARGIAYLALDGCEDIAGYDLWQHLDAVLAFVEAETSGARRSGRVLVHCFAGSNRSASFAIAALLVTTREPLEPLVARCFALRPFILKNKTFRRRAERRERRRGAFATCYACCVQGSAAPLAAKVVVRGRWVWIGGRSVPGDVAVESLRREARALRRVGEHAHVVELRGLRSEPEREVLLMSLAPGGDLAKVALDCPSGMPADTVRHLLRGLLAALARPAADEGRRLYDKCGTKPWCAPEILSCGTEGYAGPPVDLWSAGICLFALLCGKMPFAIADEAADPRYARVAAAQASGESACGVLRGWLASGKGGALDWGDGADALLDGLLAAQPGGRLSATEAGGSAHEERTCVWRGVESATRADCLRGQSPGDGRHGSGTGATAAEYPSQKVRYAVAQHGWLRDENEHGARLPVIEVDLPFKVGRDNNRNYRWGQQADSPAPLPNGGYPR
ncbi:hypothetical protein EMIHUDRAFT_196275 [Emiliania huxleyi CCMP1516]|uniref:Protein-serine/threonine phosphatase n=2 Tax=Emiliania huxleyi TaxID=2903 RepID=A0A0D3J3T2_EMIH1|nr:hypothetical protein EMIHUDRAFT_196275 [Emiliania huxleyi CCMP1516]EOD18167.1 hypothetical protein EMIHUDRAFT_196275 [Emiliania huxleyi CCMP1516]|eukprot:XP_005770596.1 hypothetical protein EMIHUDRAFT_196275 [Emiliania huxleyi CCMP1516]